MTNYIDPQGKLMMHVDRVAEVKAGGKPAPINVEIDLSNRCNLGCRGCHFAYTHTRGPLAAGKPVADGVSGGGDLIDTGMILAALEEMYEFGVRSVTWAGGGEPTLHPDFDEIIDACPLPQGIYTNGTLVDEARAELLKTRMEWVYVSLDRHNRESYKQYKQADAFKKAIAGIEALVAAPGKATVGVGYLLSRENIDDLDAMVRTRRVLGVDYIQFRPEVRYNLASPQELAEETDWISNAVALLEQVRGFRGVVVDVDRFKMYQNWLIHPYKTCYWTQFQTVITPDGSLWDCCNRRGFAESKLGNLHDEPFSAIWQRSHAVTVNKRCRLLCRGHLANLALDRMMSDPRGHENFV